MCADLKLSNVLFDVDCTTKHIDDLLLTDGPPILEGKCNIYDKQYPIIRSQPIPHKFAWNTSRHLTELLDITLTDFGHGAV
jgi:serine/threonine-protein kinase SRPK3